MVGFSTFEARTHLDECVLSTLARPDEHILSAEDFLHDESVGRIVVYYQDSRVLKVLVNGLACTGPNAKMNGEVERRTLSLLTLRPDTPAHQLDKLAGDRKTQPRRPV